MESQNSNKLIVKNATMLYIRMFISMAIGFYTSRVILKALGAEDFGLYNIVGGVVVLMSSLNASFSSATSRFLSYNMNDKSCLAKTFSNAFLIHFALSVIVLIIGETIGLWFINTQLVIDSNRIFAANCVYQAALISAVLGITQIPYNASIIAHERMNIYALVDILSSSLKLAIALCILFFPYKDSLIQYSLLYTLVSVGIMMIYRVYCIRHFEECHIIWNKDKMIMQQMLGFVGWNFFSEICFTIRQQGLNIILNRAFGTIINAASGVALQVQAILYGFIGNITTAFKPQIIKSYADKDYERCNQLIMTGAKSTSFFILLSSLPVLVNLKFLMELWLGDVPKGAVVLGQICITQNFINSFNAMTNTCVVATGKLKKLSVWSGVLHLLCVISAYWALKVTNLYYIVYCTSALFSFIMCVVNMLIAKKQFKEFEHIKYLTGIILTMITIFIVSAIIAMYIFSLIPNEIMRLFITSFASVVLISLMTYMLVLNSNEKKLILNKIRRK